MLNSSNFSIKNIIKKLFNNSTLILSLPIKHLSFYFYLSTFLFFTFLFKHNTNFYTNMLSSFVYVWPYYCSKSAIKEIKIILTKWLLLYQMAVSFCSTKNKYEFKYTSLSETVFWIIHNVKNSVYNGNLFKLIYHSSTILTYC